jgi:hypothetical protein
MRLLNKPISLSLLAAVLLLGSCGKENTPAAPEVPPTISLPTIAGLFQPEGQLQVSFNITGTFKSDNTFTAQLSDGSGSFAAPTAIGTLTSATAGTITATLPASIANGTAYRVRVLASSPAITSPDNGSNLSIAAPTIVISSFATSPTANQTIVAGRDVTINIVTTGVFAADNQFNLEISNSTGTFSASLGGSTGATLSSRTVAIPTTVPAGNGYRFRITSSKPAIQSAFSSTFNIGTLSIGAPTIIGGANLVAGGNLPIQIPAPSTVPWFNGNQLSVQLSDASGNFSNPVVLATASTLLATSFAFTTNIFIPTNTPVGTGYRVRAVTTNPVVISTVSDPFSIGALPTLTLEATSATAVPFTKIYSATTGSIYFYRVKVTRTGTLNANTTFAGQVSGNNQTFISGAPEFFFGFTTTNLTELQNNGFTFLQVQSTNWGSGNRRLRIVGIGHSVISNELQMPVFQTGITSVNATVEGTANNFSTNRFVAGSPATVYENNQMVNVGGSNTTTLFGAANMTFNLILNLSNENVVTGSQTARIVVNLTNSSGGLIATYNNDSVTLSVSGTPTTGYTLVGSGPYTLTRTSSTTGGNTSITVGSVSSSFRMQ